MTEPTPIGSVAAHELSRYPAEKVLALIEAAKQWRSDSYGRWAEDVDPRRLIAAVDALTEGSG